MPDDDTACIHSATATNQLAAADEHPSECSSSLHSGYDSVVGTWRVQGRTTATWIPSVVFTIVTFVTGLMALLLPETLNRPLPETIEEIESWTRSLVPRGPRLTGDGSAQVQEPSTSAADALQIADEPFQDVEELDVKLQESTDM